MNSWRLKQQAPTGSWEPASMQNQLKTEENFKTQVSQRAAPALCAQLQIGEKKDERIRLGVGGRKDKLAGGSQDESK